MFPLTEETAVKIGPFKSTCNSIDHRGLGFARLPESEASPDVTVKLAIDIRDFKLDALSPFH
jgi:hypothetical protein